MKRKYLFTPIFALIATALPNIAVSAQSQHRSIIHPTDISHELALNEDMQVAPEALRALHRMNQNEIAFSIKVEQKSNSLALRQYASSVFRDHLIAELYVIGIASKAGITLESIQPLSASETEEMQAHDEIMSKLATLSGEEFDKAVLDHAIEHHSHKIKVLTRLQNRHPDNVLARLIRMILVPTETKHLALAKKVQEELQF